MKQPGAKAFFSNVNSATSVDATVDNEALFRVEEIIAGLDCLHEKTENPDAGALHKSLSLFQETLLEHDVSHSFKVNELAAWVVMEILDTGVDLEEVDVWLCHKPTLDEIIFGEDADSLLYQFVNKKDRSNRRKFRSMLRKRGLSKRKAKQGA